MFAGTAQVGLTPDAIRDGHREPAPGWYRIPARVFQVVARVLRDLRDGCHLARIVETIETHGGVKHVPRLAAVHEVSQTVWSPSWT